MKDEYTLFFPSNLNHIKWQRSLLLKVYFSLSSTEVGRLHSGFHGSDAHIHKVTGWCDMWQEAGRDDRGPENTTFIGLYKSETCSHSFRFQFQSAESWYHKTRSKQATEKLHWGCKHFHLVEKIRYEIFLLGRYKKGDFFRFPPPFILLWMAFFSPVKVTYIVRWSVGCIEPLYVVKH